MAMDTIQLALRSLSDTCNIWNCVKTKCINKVEKQIYKSYSALHTGFAFWIHLPVLNLVFFIRFLNITKRIHLIRVERKDFSLIFLLWLRIIALVTNDTVGLFTTYTPTFFIFKNSLLAESLTLDLRSTLWHHGITRTMWSGSQVRL